MIIIYLHCKYVQYSVLAIWYGTIKFDVYKSVSNILPYLRQLDSAHEIDLNTVVNANCSLTLTTFFIQPAPGVKLN
jgi:hypothetical protein